MAMIVSAANLPDQPIVYVNKAFEALSGYSRAELVGRNCRLLQGPGTDPVEVTRIRQALARDNHVHVELLNYRKDGTEFWNSLYVSPVHDENGKTTHFFASQLDVTHRRQAHIDLEIANAELAEAKRLLERQVDDRTAELVKLLHQRTDLARELDHRVKNNLQMIAALISLEGRRDGTFDRASSLETLRRRVNAISLAYKKIYNTETAGNFNVTAFLQDLADFIVSSAKRDDIQVAVTRDLVELPAQKASPLSVMLDELLRSAIAHAYRNRGGALRLDVTRCDRSGLEFLVADGYFSDAQKSSTRAGIDEHIVGILARQLQAEINWHPDEPGKLVSFTITPTAEELERSQRHA